MKSKLLLFSFIVLFPLLQLHSQTSASTAGIAVQGIARDNNNTARTAQTIPFIFTLYYKENGTNVNVVSPININLLTDAYGVFSYIIDPLAASNSKFANNEVWLKIEADGVEVSNEKLKHVPYAIAANNGVPTGSILPFVGASAPEGWALCDGQSLIGKPGSADLIALLGSNNTPDLRGMFIRGTGTSPVNNQAGPALKATQQDALKSHSHGSGSLVNSTNGNHVHVWNHDMEGDDSGSGSSYSEFTGKPGSVAGDQVMGAAGDHTHSISGSTATTGDTETRPVNYGVNYIIKL